MQDMVLMPAVTVKVMNDKIKLKTRHQQTILTVNIRRYGSVKSTYAILSVNMSAEPLWRNLRTRIVYIKSYS